MVRGPLDTHPQRAEEKALRALVKAGCGRDELRLIATWAGTDPPTGVARARRLSEISEFAVALGRPAALDYFRAIRETKAVAELTDERVLAFARSIDRHTAEWYFWAMWGTRAVGELTSDRVLNAVEFFGSIDSPATVEYFLAIRETKAIAELTDERVLAFAQEMGSEVAVEYFGAFWETRAAAKLTAARVLEFARSIGREAAQEYFRAVRETGAVARLTDPKVLAAVRGLGSRVAEELFRAVRGTKAPMQLTDENVLLFAELIGPAPAREYFRVVRSTNAVAELTAEGVLRTSGVIRSIGSDAAVDYFLAIAATKAVPRAGTEGGGVVPNSGSTVPLLTLVEIPAYDRYRPVGLLGTSVVFWWAAWQFAGLSWAAPLGLGNLGVAVGVWVVLLAAVYLLVGSIAERSAEQFLERRRRLLNEHGIRWHDCFATDRRCELCWSAGRTHEDRWYDYGRICRCPAC